MSSRFIQVVTYCKIPFLLKGWIVFCCMYMLQFLYKMVLITLIPMVIRTGNYKKCWTENVDSIKCSCYRTAPLIKLWKHILWGFRGTNPTPWLLRCGWVRMVSCPLLKPLYHLPALYDFVWTQRKKVKGVKPSTLTHSWFSCGKPDTGRKSELFGEMVIFYLLSYCTM